MQPPERGLSLHELAEYGESDESGDESAAGEAAGVGAIFGTADLR